MRDGATHGSELEDALPTGGVQAGPERRYGMSDQTTYGDDELKDAGDTKSGDESGEPVHSPTIPEDEGNPGDGTGEGVAGPASGTTEGDDAVGIV
ncbi:MAG: hypothetical protein QOJ89_4340 [bacterium]|jgi:hypothetical protein